MSPTEPAEFGDEVSPDRDRGRTVSDRVGPSGSELTPDPAGEPLRDAPEPTGIREVDAAIEQLRAVPGDDPQAAAAILGEVLVRLERTLKQPSGPTH